MSRIAAFVPLNASDVRAGGTRMPGILAQLVDQFLRHAVDEYLVVHLVGQVEERQDGDRCL